jgi:hypothetical protein
MSKAMSVDYRFSRCSAATHNLLVTAAKNQTRLVISPTKNSDYSPNVIFFGRRVSTALLIMLDEALKE